jgi:hypothetical protein
MVQGTVPEHRACPERCEGGAGPGKPIRRWGPLPDADATGCEMLMCPGAVPYITYGCVYQRSGDDPVDGVKD